MKFDLNNFIKAYLLFSIVAIGWLGGEHAYHIAFKLLEFMAIFMVIFTPIMAIFWYVTLKILLYFNPNFGYKTNGQTDAQSIILQMEESFQGLKECVKHPFQTLILILMNIIAFLKS